MTNALKLAEYYAFIEFCATPKFQRELKSQMEFCIQYGVTKDTLARWKQDSNFREDVARKRKELGFDQTTEVIGAMYAGIMSERNPSLIKIWLTMFADYKDQSESKHLLEAGGKLMELLGQEFSADDKNKHKQLMLEQSHDTALSSNPQQPD